MVEDRWFRIAVPILEALHEREAEFYTQIGDLADALSLDPMDVVREVERLIRDGYLTGKLGKVMSGGNPRPWHLSSFALTGDGARVIGSWPSDNPYEALLALLDLRIGSASDHGTRSRLRKFKDGLITLSSEVGANTIASVLVELGKMAV